MSEEVKTTQPIPLLSHFRTTVRNELHTWIARTVIYAAYFSIVFFLLSTFLSSSTPTWNILLLVSTVPVLLQLTTWDYWTMGFKSRTQLFFVSILILVAYYLIDDVITLRVFWTVMIVHLALFFVRRLIARKRHAPDALAILLTIFLVGLGYFGWAIFLRNSLFPGWFFVVQRILTIVVICFFAVIPILQSIDRIGRVRRLEKLDRSHNFNVSLRMALLNSIFFLVGFVLILAHGENPPASVSALAIFIFSAKPGLALSRQKSHVEFMLNWLGVNNLKTQVPTEPTPLGLINIQLDYIKKRIEHNRQYVSIVLVLVSSVSAITYLAVNYDLFENVAEFATAVTMVAFSLALIYLLFWFMKNRKKHIVLPFTVAEGQAEPQLHSLANLMTYAFVQQLRYMALLLSMKQVENIASRNDNTLPVFATSGQEKNLIEQFRSLGDIEIASNKIPFGGLLAIIGNSTAHTRVSGTVVRQKDNSIAVLVEFVQRGGQVVAVDMDFVPETSAADLDEKIIANIAKTLAVKLVIKLGNHPHLASSWKSMLNFVNGLEAAYRRNWWQAISYYRKSIHDEEASNGPAGPAYYHLGASLVSQGNIMDGYKYLRIAEQKNAPQAEVQYMIALTQFYMFHDFLHLERAIFEDIKYRCSLALKRRPYFPEAHHLLGTVHYQRGKLLERAFTKDPMEADEKYAHIEVLPQDYPGDYKKAIYHLEKAIRGYNRTLRHLPHDIVSHNTIFDERAKLIQYKMSATHRCGDALRSLERFSEADAYYRRTLYAYPINLRTLVDRAKALCFSGNWQKADEFIRYDIFNNEEYRSNKSANFYMGWALAGGLMDEFSRSSRFTDVFIQIYEMISNIRRIDQSVDSPLWKKVWIVAKDSFLEHRRDALEETADEKMQEHIKLLGRSMLFLDYAIHQYPRYIHRWRQTNWYDDFNQVAKNMLDLNMIDPVNFQKTYYFKPLDNTKRYHVGQIYYWLCWRVALSLPLNERDIDTSIRKEIGWISLRHLKPYIPNPNFYKLFRSLILSKGMFERILEASDKEGVVCNLFTRVSKLELGKKMFKQWQDAHDLLEEKIGSLNQQVPPRLSFADRWAIDIFAEYSMLLCHVLAEAEAYETVAGVGRRSLMILKPWIALWNKSMTEGFYFSSKLLDYQIASIGGWVGYSMFMGAQDYATQNRLYFSDSFHQDEKDLDIEKAQWFIDDALRFVPNHPLALFLKALVLNKTGHKTKAADELNRLLSLLSPFDPHVYSRRNSYIENIEVPNRKITRLKSENTHQFLVYGERSCGDLQFSNVMSLSQIHTQLGKIAHELEDHRTSTGHMIQAFADTPYHDEQADIFITITEMLNKNGQYANALSVLDEANLWRRYLSPVHVPNARSLQVLVMECVLKTNMENYRDSLDRGIEISNNWGNVDLSQGQETIIDIFLKKDPEKNLASTQCLIRYEKNLLSLFREIERDAKFEGIVNNKQILKRLLNALETNTVLKIMNSVLLENGIRDVEAPINLELVIISQVLTEMYRDIVLFTIQQCEWMNNCAFNYCELDFNLAKAEDYSKTAIELTERLQKNSAALKLVDLKEKLAQYYDTSAWINYRKGPTAENLNNAYMILNTKALLCEQESPLIYYHLARIRLSQIERIWQSLPLTNDGETRIDNKKALLISQYLGQAFLYWRHAHRLDGEKSLYLRLRTVRLRIDQYRKNWERYVAPTDKEKMEK